MARFQTLVFQWRLFLEGGFPREPRCKELYTKEPFVSQNSKYIFSQTRVPRICKPLDNSTFFYANAEHLRFMMLTRLDVLVSHRHYSLLPCRRRPSGLYHLMVVQSITNLLLVIKGNTLLIQGLRTCYLIRSSMGPNKL